LAQAFCRSNKKKMIAFPAPRTMVCPAVLLFFAAMGSAGAVTPSPGCSNPTEGGLGSALEPGGQEDFRRKIPRTQRRRHRLHLPTDYGSEGVVSPVLLYFHGWGGNHGSCGALCSERAVAEGFVTVSMTGYGPSGWNSWKHGGSSDSAQDPDPPGSSACSPETQGFCEEYRASGCGCAQEDSRCTWTTCYDSVQQVLGVLDEVGESLCVDLDQVWAMGCSNGGMFTFELARDGRSAPRLKGIVPIVGLPHHGYSEGPLLGDTKMIGMWGRYDEVTPPISNTDDPDRTSDPDGWYYTSSDRVMSDWTRKKGCAGDGRDPMGQDDFGVSNYGDALSCTQGCGERAGDSIVGCVFEGGHDCFRDFMWEPIFRYMLRGEGGDGDGPDPCTDAGGKFRLPSGKRKSCAWFAKKNPRVIRRRCKPTFKVGWKGESVPLAEVCKATCSEAGQYECSP